MLGRVPNDAVQQSVVILLFETTADGLCRRHPWEDHRTWPACDFKGHPASLVEVVLF